MKTMDNNLCAAYNSGNSVPASVPSNFDGAKQQIRYGPQVVRCGLAERFADDVRRNGMVDYLTHNL